MPYAGFVGDYQGITVLEPTPFGLPWLAKLIGGSSFNQPGGATYTLVGLDIPFFLVHLERQPRLLRMEVFDAHTGKAWHRAFELAYVPRSSSSTSFFAFTRDGFTASGRSGCGVRRSAVAAPLADRIALDEAPLFACLFW